MYAPSEGLFMVNAKRSLNNGVFNSIGTHTRQLPIANWRRCENKSHSLRSHLLNNFVPIFRRSVRRSLFQFFPFGPLGLNSQSRSRYQPLEMKQITISANFVDIENSAYVQLEHMCKHLNTSNSQVYPFPFQLFPKRIIYENYYYLSITFVFVSIRHANAFTHQTRQKQHNTTHTTDISKPNGSEPWLLSGKISDIFIASALCLRGIPTFMYLQSRCPNRRIQIDDTSAVCVCVYIDASDIV